MSAMNQGNSLYHMRKSLFRITWAVYRHVTLFCIGMILLYPILYMVTTSLKTAGQLNDPLIVWLPRAVTLKNYVEAFNQMKYAMALKNTALISLISTVLTLVSCAMAGYGFSRFRFKFRGVLFAIVIFMIIVPPQSFIISNYLQYRNFDFFGIGRLVGLFTGKPLSINLINSNFTMYIPAALGNGIRAGLFILIFRKFFGNIPHEMEEAAYIDGCGVYRTFGSVILPNAMSSIVTVFLFSFVWYWNDFFYVSAYMNNSITISTQLAHLKNTLNEIIQAQSNRGIVVDPNEVTLRLMAGCLMAILPVMLIYTVMQKWLASSIDRTAAVVG